jgi:bifunctional non-homologous end joining protein LigD
MSLKTYRQKRDFRITTEPRGDARKSPTSNRLFVIQKHAATRLHYDLRLELDGVLKSWAIPKGPSLDPDEKRLAVHVEDHPIEYGRFEGIIPPKEYGGGTVMLWDTGTWVPEGDPAKDYEKGRMHLEIYGQKLRGSWRLVRMQGSDSEADKNWLLVKSKDLFSRKDTDQWLLTENKSVLTGRTMEQIAADADAVWKNDQGTETQNQASNTRRRTRSETDGFNELNGFKGLKGLKGLKGARKTKFPDHLRPQLASLIDAPPQGSHWLHEIKYDGYRMLAFIEKGSVRITSRSGKDWTARFPAIARALAETFDTQAVVDGEIVVQLPDGRTSFQALQNMLQGLEKGRLRYYLFDMLYCDGYDLKALPLIERKRLLKRFFDPEPSSASPVRYSEHVAGAGDAVYEQACRLALEGIISKESGSPYKQARTRQWVKVKCRHRQEFVIGGYTEPSGSRTGLGALLLGIHDDQQKLRYCGKVGTGFNDRQLQTLRKTLDDLERKTPPFDILPKEAKGRHTHWVEPRLVAEVAFGEWTDDGVLRHAVFKGLREDKAPRQVHREQTVTPRKSRVHLTHPDRILYPRQGVTKASLVHYYEQIADYILPHLIDRPLTLLRCPKGIDGSCFYQKHFNESPPEFLKGIEIEEKGGKGTYILIEGIDGLISLVQMGVLEIHPWNARKDRIEKPDLMVMDLDPGPGVGPEAVVESTRLLHGFLSEIGLRSFLKSSGGKGYHVVVPLKRSLGWDELKAFAKAVAVQMTRAYPDRFTATISKKKREGKIFLDYLRNGRGATSVAPYSTRARAGAPVSAPLRWEELSSQIPPDFYRIENMGKRIDHLREDPWNAFYDSAQSITQSIKKRVGL